jgi:hypothetical protein
LEFGALLVSIPRSLFFCLVFCRLLFVSLSFFFVLSNYAPLFAWKNRRFPHNNVSLAYANVFKVCNFDRLTDTAVWQSATCNCAMVIVFIDTVLNLQILIAPLVPSSVSYDMMV